MNAHRCINPAVQNVLFFFHGLFHVSFSKTVLGTDIFFKKDVYEGIAILGSSADYESLKESGKTAAAKIK
jgi:hypothetical protein